MWNDDRVWLPQVLAGELIEMEGVFENDEFCRVLAVEAEKH